MTRVARHRGARPMVVRFSGCLCRVGRQLPRHGADALGRSRDQASFADRCEKAARASAGAGGVVISDRTSKGAGLTAAP